mgnify:CR=1 FL=1
MPEIENDQVADGVIKDQPSGEQPKEEPITEEPVTAERAFELAKGLQKGYTQTRQEIAEMRENLQTIAAALNKETGAASGDDDYITAGKLKEILTEHSQSEAKAKEAEKINTDTYIDNCLTQLRADGVVKSKEDEESLLNYAIGKKEIDLLRAADRWQEIKLAREEGKKEAAKAKAKQEEGSQVGTSSRASSSPEQGINYTTLKQMIARGEI